MISAAIDEAAPPVVIAIDTMTDEVVAAMVDVMTTVVVLPEATMTMIEEATVAAADVIEMIAMVVALASTDMKAAADVTTMAQAVIDEVVDTMRAEVIAVIEAMVARRLLVTRFLVKPMAVVETILLAKIDTAEDRSQARRSRHAEQFATIRWLRSLVQALYSQIVSRWARLFQSFWREMHNNTRRKRSDRQSYAS